MSIASPLSVLIDRELQHRLARGGLGVPGCRGRPAAASAASPSSGAALRTCSATLARLGFDGDAGRTGRDRGQLRDDARPAVRCRSSCAKPVSNSAPWLPTRCTVDGIAGQLAQGRAVPGRRSGPRRSSRRVRPAPAAPRRRSGSGRASAGWLTIGARVPSKSEATSRRGLCRDRVERSVGTSCRQGAPVRSSAARRRR